MHTRLMPTARSGCMYDTLQLYSTEGVKNEIIKNPVSRSICFHRRRLGSTHSGLTRPSSTWRQEKVRPRWQWVALSVNAATGEAGGQAAASSGNRRFVTTAVSSAALSSQLADSLEPLASCGALAFDSCGCTEPRTGKRPCVRPS
jgi:hypothetical protein